MTQKTPDNPKNTIKIKWPLIVGILIAVVLLVFILSNSLNTTKTADTQVKPEPKPLVDATAKTADAQAQPEPKPLVDAADAIALVNQKPISTKAVEEQLALRNRAYAESGAQLPEGQSELDSKMEVLDSMINLELVTEKAKSLGFSPYEEDLEKTLQDVIAQYGTIEQLESTLKSFGLTMDQFREQVANNLAIKNYRDIAFLAQAKVSEQQAKEFYESNIDSLTHPDQVRALQIMIPKPFPQTETDAEVAAQALARAKARAEQALNEAKEGADFQNLIDEYMDQPTKMATNAGQLGLVNRGESGFPELEETLFNLKPGEVGGLIESDYSFHIVKALENKPAGVTPFEEVRWEIFEYLTENNIDMAFAAEVEKLRAEASIEILDPEIKAAWDDFQTKIHAAPSIEEGEPQTPNQAEPEVAP